jgi:hypothetical protein
MVYQWTSCKCDTNYTPFSHPTIQSVNDSIQYAQTSEHWVQLQDANRAAGIAELERDAKAKGFDPIEGRKAYYRFRTFFLAVAVFFAMHNGEEWGVGHYLFAGRK